jgi:hypothetical protein
VVIDGSDAKLQCACTGSSSPSAEQSSWAWRKVARWGVALPHPRIYGAALEQEPLTEIYGPAYLQGSHCSSTTWEAEIYGPLLSQKPVTLVTLVLIWLQPLSRERKDSVPSVSPCATITLGLCF